MSMLEHVSSLSALAGAMDPMSPTPLYRQLADLLAERIERGNLQPGDPLPSESDLMRRYRLSRGTVRAALRALRERGLVVTVQARGTYVTERRVG